MSNKKVKIVPIKESSLVDLIENIVNEAVAVQKQEWIAEQEAKKESLLESKINKLEKVIAELTSKTK